MASTTLYLKRKIKTLSLRFNLHKFLGPLPNAFLQIAYLAEFARWRAKNSNPQFNDFYLSQWNYDKRYALYDFLYTSNMASGPINYLEFGVAQGHSFKWWAGKNQDAASRFYGFDTFTGLPEDWDQFKAGDMSTGGKVPDIQDSRVEFFKGLFQDTLPGFLTRIDRTKRNVIHMDADLYTSTLYVLTMLDPFLKPGDIILFDEFGVPTHEFLAWTNYTASYPRKFELVAAANNYFFTAFRVL
jgi:O-methyltransferase